MTRWSWLLVAGGLAATGCTMDPGTPPGTHAIDPLHLLADGTFDGAVPPPGDCAQDIALYGMGPSGPTRVPVSLDTTGVTLCLALDGTDNLVVAHFAASTPHEVGTVSSFVMALYDADGTLIGPGWDLSWGENPTTVFASIEAGFPKGQVSNVRLTLATRTGARDTEVALYLFEPYE